MTNSKDELGDRMKDYERRETDRRFLPYLPICARIDGRSFSKFTKGMQTPFDHVFSMVMAATTQELVRSTAACFGYTQSDEISLVWITRDPKQEMPFGGKVQKLTSTLAASATVNFYKEGLKQGWGKTHLLGKTPTFDCRVFQLPNEVEAANVILWREIDARKNAISKATREFYSTKQMHGKGQADQLEMLKKAGVNFEKDYPLFIRQGMFFQRRKVWLSPYDPKLGDYNVAKTPIERSVVEQMLHLPPKFSMVENRVDVIFNGAKPITQNIKGNETSLIIVDEWETIKSTIPDGYSFSE